LTHIAITLPISTYQKASSDPARPNELWGWAILAQTTGEEAWQHGLHTKSFVFCGHLSGCGGFHQQSVPEQGLRLRGDGEQTMTKGNRGTGFKRYVLKQSILSLVGMTC